MGRVIPHSVDTQLEEIEDKVDIVDAVVDIVEEDTDMLYLEHAHITYIFPENTNETVTFAAHASANTWSNWAEIVDNNAVTLSSKITADAHLTTMLIESISIKDKVFLFEVAYSDAKTITSRYRFIAGDTPKLPAIQAWRIRAAHMPPGEKIYYRMKCSSGGATCELHFRYHYCD